MSDKKGKISLSGLSKGSSTSSTSPYPSFRFSPENEEIEEILMEEPCVDDQPESLPESPKASGGGGGGGDVSPLKEYILKHKWATWDKRSLSLDLDLKGKIITAIEDKRKSIVSHFIPEETGISIPSSQSITEHIGYVTGDENTNGGSQGTTKQTHSTNNSEFFESSPEDFEEIGMDYLASLGLEEDEDLLLSLPFVVGGEELQEHYGGQLTLYQPASIGGSKRQDETCDKLKEDGEEDYSVNLPPPSSSPDYADNPEIESISPSTIFQNMLYAFMYHKYAAVWFLFFAALFMIPSGFFMSVSCFIFGILTATICVQSWIQVNEYNDGTSGILKQPAEIEIPSYVNENVPLMKEMNLPTKSQGWMTEFEGEYDALTCHIRMTRVVFVRLDGKSLYISYPHPKHRVPKRRLWSDPVINTEFTFVRHDVYNLTNATVFIAPDKLARKRAWNKKYPIGIRLPENCIYSKVSPTQSLDTVASSLDTSSPGHNHPSSSPTKDIKNKKSNKEIFREDCSQKILYLFSRTDREKDDWFRRIRAAVRMASGALQPEDKLQPDGLDFYRDYMRRIVPLIIPTHSTHDTSDKFETVSIGMDKVSISKSPTEKHEKQENKGGKDKEKGKEKGKGKEKESPSTSRKSTPDKEKAPKDYSNSHDSSESSIENITTVPQSPAFFNALLGRIFLDFLQSPYWKDQIRNLIQKKLFYTKKPSFLGELRVKDLDLGCAIPIIQRASTPILDHQGLWIDLDITYDGRMVVVLETHLNLLKLRKSPSVEDDSTCTPSHPPGPPAGGNNHTHPPHSSSHPNLDSGSILTMGANLFDSDADDSGESSEEEIDPDDFLTAHPIDERNLPPSTSDPNTGKGKILRIAEKFASSKYMNTKVVKKVVGNLGNTPLLLSVELKSIVGSLVLNIPPPPTDRLWFGFRTNPNIQIIARPKFGERAVNLTHVTDWIKRKILLEFQRVMVLPNMNDVSIPLMEFKLPK